ncbi:MAG: phosphoglucosamine mutase, partial [Bacteroidota bacterium]|nr:phosphoglucosamine mutase [Bacteroidota bacterium]
RWMHFQAISEHIRTLWRHRWLQNLREKIRHRAFHVVVDAVNAAGSFILPQLLQHLYCRVTLLHANGSGIFPHSPEPLPQHLQELATSVQRYSADIGIGVDPDADRLVLVDESGKCLWEELTIALAAQTVLEHAHQACANRYNPVVVVNYSTSSVIDDIAQAYRAQVLRSPVGEANVVRRLQESLGVIGGEGSGGVILPHIHYGRDALVGTVLVLGLMAHCQKRLSELVTALPRPIMRKHVLAQPQSVSTLLEQVFAYIAQHAEEIRRDDGLYARFGKSWFHLRPSNTEPVVRFIVEAPTQKEVEQLEAMILPLLR